MSNFDRESNELVEELLLQPPALVTHDELKAYKAKLSALLRRVERGASEQPTPGEQPSVSKSLTSYEAWDYARLKVLETRGYKEQEELRKAPKMTAEAIVAFINQLSPWNLKTTGVSILQAYVQQQGGVTGLLITGHNTSTDTADAPSPELEAEL